VTIETRRRQIEEVASELFRANGYAATSVRDIARALDLQGASLYSHVASKEDVLWALVDRAATRFETALAEAETLAALGGTLVSTEDPLPQLVGQLRAAFVADSVAVLRAREGGWTVEAGAGEPLPNRPEDGRFAVPSGRDGQLVVLGPATPDEDPEVLRSFAAQVQVALERRQLYADVAAAVSATGTDIRAMELKGVDGKVVGSMLVEVENLTHLEKIMRAVRKVKGISDIARRDNVTAED